MNESQIIKPVVQHGSTNRTKITRVGDAHQAQPIPKTDRLAAGCLVVHPSPSALTVLKIGCNPPWITRLIEKEKEPAVFPVFHDQRALSEIVMLLEMQYKSLKLFLRIAVDAYG